LQRIDEVWTCVGIMKQRRKFPTIMMTTLAALMGAVPLLGFWPGGFLAPARSAGDCRRPDFFPLITLFIRQ